ncbi:MAG: TonB family protein [Treponema sp.]|nr:TonB family protein [Treponema sp.]
MALHALVIGVAGAALSPMGAVKAPEDVYVAFEFEETNIDETANELEVPSAQPAIREEAVDVSNKQPESLTPQADQAIDKVSNAELIPEPASLAEVPVEASNEQVPVVAEAVSSEPPLAVSEPPKASPVEPPANVTASAVPQFADSDREVARIPAVWGNAGESGGLSANPSVSNADYLALVMRHLEQRKVYPLAARKRGMEGDITITFVITADGKADKISATGEHRYLVQAAEQSVRQASPFPVPSGATFDARLVIRYRLDE